MCRRHHCSVGPTTGRNPGGRQNSKKKKEKKAHHVQALAQAQALLWCRAYAWSIPNCQSNMSVNEMEQFKVSKEIKFVP